MGKNRNIFSMQAMCNVLKVSRSGFYAWLNRPQSKRKQDDKYYLDLITTRFEASHQTYGYRRIHSDIGEKCGINPIGQLMRVNNITPKAKRKFKVTTDSKHNKPIYNKFVRKKF